MPSGKNEVLVGSQQLQVMMPAQLNQQGVNGTDLYTVPAADVAYVGGFDMVGASRFDVSQCRKSARQCFSGLGA